MSPEEDAIGAMARHIEIISSSLELENEDLVLYGSSMGALAR